MVTVSVFEFQDISASVYFPNMARGMSRKTPG